MSKISNYIQAIRDHYRKISEERLAQTVISFAEDLKKPVDVLLFQLRSAGVQKKETDVLTDQDKQALLVHLQKAHGVNQEPRKKIVISPEPSVAAKLWDAVAKNENGAARDAIEHFAELVIWEQPVDSDLQRLVNLIVAKSVVEGGLPPMKRGRPKSEEGEQVGRKIAQTYWDMRDGGKSYAETVAWICERVHKDERHVMRIVTANKSWVGETIEERVRRRCWKSMMQTMREKSNGSGTTLYENYLTPTLPQDLQSPDLEWSDYLDHIEELIQKEARQKPSLTQKVRDL